MLKTASALVAVVAVIAAAPLARAQGVVVDVTPEEQAYQARTDAHIRQWIHEENREATEEERHYITQHWERAAKLWRIRKLARAANDMATVARVDRLMARADILLQNQLARMRMHAPVMTMAPGEVEVATAPPPPQVEVQGAPPAPGNVWTPGYWHWNGHRHVWIRGHWAAPPQVGMTWEPAKWENRGGRWYFRDGRWAVGAVAPNVVYEPPPPPAQVVEVETAPPPPMVEVRPAGPRGGVWIPGYWHWNPAIHRHVWIGGRWSAARAGMHWEPDHWVHVGRAWHLEHGHWAR